MIAIEHIKPINPEKGRIPSIRLNNILKPHKSIEVRMMKIMTLGTVSKFKILVNKLFILVVLSYLM